MSRVHIRLSDIEDSGFIMLRIRDGQPPVKVRRVRGPVRGISPCKDDRHCACHGSGPEYPCCRCGCSFRPVD